MSHPDYKKIGSPTIRIVEECGEILQAIGKGDRFGWRNHHPDRPSSNNFSELQMEIFDLNEAFEDLKRQIQQKDSPDCPCEHASKLACDQCQETDTGSPLNNG